MKSWQMVAYRERVLLNLLIIIVVIFCFSQLLTNISEASYEPNNDREHAAQISEGMYYDSVVDDYYRDLDLYIIEVPPDHYLYFEFEKLDHNRYAIEFEFFRIRDYPPYNTSIFYHEKEVPGSYPYSYSDDWFNNDDETAILLLEMRNPYVHNSGNYSMYFDIYEKKTGLIKSYKNPKNEVEPNDDREFAQIISEGYYLGYLYYDAWEDCDVFKVDIPKNHYLEIEFTNINDPDIIVVYCRDTQGYNSNNPDSINYLELGETEIFNAFGQHFYISIYGNGDYSMNIKIIEEEMPPSLIKYHLGIGLVIICFSITILLSYVIYKLTHRKSKILKSEQINNLPNHTINNQNTHSIQNIENDTTYQAIIMER